jgi:hypothetical protein
MNFIFNDDVRILCLSCNVKKVGKLVRFKQKGQKQASFLAFHKCCQWCLLRGSRYISTSFILVFALRCYIATGYQESLFVGWNVYSSSTNKAKIYSYSIFVQQMYWLQDKTILFKQIALVAYITPGKPDGLNIMLRKQKGICNFRLRPSVEENLQTCAR